MAEFVKASAAPLCGCGERHWSTQPEKCKFYERPANPCPQPRERFGKAEVVTAAQAPDDQGEKGATVGKSHSSRGETKSKPETKIKRAGETEIKPNRGGKRPGAGRRKDASAKPKPWEAMGMSRSAYFRQQKKAQAAQTSGAK
jgi:hypothetical protein